MTDDQLFSALAERLKPFLGTVQTPPVDPGGPPQQPPPVSNPPPPPPSTDLARFLSAPSDWARWTEDNWLGSQGGGYQAKEHAAILAHLMSKYGWDEGGTRTRISQQLNAYNSTIKLGGLYDPKTRSYKFVRYIIGMPFATDDVNGAADQYVASKWPGVVPGPLV